MRWSVVVLCACGRFNFDPIGEGGASGDARGSGDATGGGTGGETCEAPRDIPLGTTLSGQTMTDATDDFSIVFCPGGGAEVVYSFTGPAVMRALSFTADFAGNLAIVEACPPTLGQCQSFSANVPRNSMVAAVAGTTYLVVEKRSGAGVTFSIGVQ